MAGGGLDPLVHGRPEQPPRTYRVVMALVGWLLRHLFRIRVVGRENVPAAPFIIASNHQAWFDAAFVITAFPRLPMIFTMARRDTVFNRRWKRRLAPRLGLFPIMPSHGELDSAGVATVYQVLARRGVVLMFPEGRYSRGSALRPLKKGVAHFALEAGVPISPVAISGIDRLRLLGRVEVSIGPPIQPDPPAWWSLNRRVVRVVDSVRRSILRAFRRPPAAAGRTRLLARTGARLRRLLGRAGGSRDPPL